jgi:ketosteroid isomerase-like protein
MSEMNNIEVVRSWMRAVNRGSLDDQLALVDPGFEMVEATDLPGAAHVSGLEQLKSYALGWGRNWSEWDWREEEIVEVPPDRILVMATLWLRGLRSGIAVERRWAYVFTVRDGRLLRQVGYNTREEALAAIGPLR